MKKLLVTGSRDFKEVSTVAAGLAWAYDHLGYGDVVLIEGECPHGGADIIARDIWWSWRRPVIGVPANWAELGKRAGQVRNQAMVDMMPDLCIGFPLPDSRGTYDCLRRAQDAGIETIDWMARRWAVD